MEYTVIFSDKSYDLPQYNLKISEKLEQVEKFSASDSPIKEKLRKMYNACTDILGKENTMEVVGKFEEADPNMLNIVYLSIVESYNKPLADFETERSAEKLNSEVFDKLKEFAESVETMSALVDKK